MSEPTPKVSIYFLCYNQAAYVRRSLDSMLAQRTDFQFEIIAVDDCSTDGTSEIIAEYAAANPGRIIHIRHERNLYRTCFFLVRDVLPVARGKYIAHHEGDDFWTDPYKLQRQADFLDSHPDYCACLTNHDILNETDLSGIPATSRVIRRDGPLSPYTVLNGGLHINTILHRTDIARDNPHIARLGSVMDGDTILQGEIATGKVWGMAASTLTYRLCGSGVYTKYRFNVGNDIMKMKERHLSVLRLLDAEYGGALRSVVNAYRAELELNRFHLLRNQGELHPSYVWRALRLSPGMVMKVCTDKVKRIFSRPQTHA